MIRRALAVTAIVGALLAGALIIGHGGEDPYGGAFTGPCSMTTDASGRRAGEVRLTDHGPPVAVGRIAVEFTDPAGRHLPMVRVDVGQGGNVSVLHGHTQAFTVAAPPGANTCEFADWAEAESTTWGGRGAG